MSIWSASIVEDGKMRSRNYEASRMRFCTQLWSAKLLHKKNMASLEHFVNSVRNLSVDGYYSYISLLNHWIINCIDFCLFIYTGSWRELYEFLSKSPEVLLRNAENLDNVLDTLDPQLHSLGNLAIYIVKFMILNQNGAQNQGPGEA